jgi:hypothetical protein
MNKFVILVALIINGCYPATSQESCSDTELIICVSDDSDSGLENLNDSGLKDSRELSPTRK